MRTEIELCDINYKLNISASSQLRALYQEVASVGEFLLKVGAKHGYLTVIAAVTLHNQIDKTAQMF